MDQTQESQQLVSIIQPNGSCLPEHRELVSDDDLVRLIKAIIFNRVLEKRLLLLQRQGRIGFTLTSTGEEATIVGSTYALQDQDPVFLTYRELGVLLWRGVPLEKIINQFIGNSQDAVKGRQMPVHYCFKDYYIPSVSSPVGTQLTQACGYAYAAKLQGTGQVALAFLGEGTASSNDFHAALNFAGVMNAPAIFLIRNNGYAISTPESAQTAAESLVSRAEGYGIAGVQIDGNDLLAVIQSVKEAADRARNGLGPTLIEAMTYRLGAHSSSDNPSEYRPETEEKEWQPFGPLIRLTSHAKWRGIWTDKDYAQTEAEMYAKISAAITKCEKWPPPKVDSLFDDVYESVPSHLQSQKEAYKSYLDRKIKEDD